MVKVGEFYIVSQEEMDQFCYWFDKYRTYKIVSEMKWEDRERSEAPRFEDLFNRTI